MSSILKVRDILPFQINEELNFTGAKAYYVDELGTVFLRSIHGTSLLLSRQLFNEIIENTFSKKLSLILKSRGFKIGRAHV